MKHFQILAIVEFHDVNASIHRHVILQEIHVKSIKIDRYLQVIPRGSPLIDSNLSVNDEDDWSCSFMSHITSYISMPRFSDQDV